MKARHCNTALAAVGLLLSTMVGASANSYTSYLPFIGRNARPDAIPTAPPPTSTPTLTATPMPTTTATPTRTTSPTPTGTATAAPSATPTATPLPPIIILSYSPNADSPLEELVILRGPEHKFDPSARVSGAVGLITAAWYIDSDDVPESTEIDPAPMTFAPGEYHPRVEFSDQAGQVARIGLPRIVKVGECVIEPRCYGVNENMSFTVQEAEWDTALELMRTAGVQHLRLHFN